MEGDIIRADLGVEDLDALKKRTTEIFHLAAVYDLSTERDLALRVNVDGTRHMLDLAEDCPGLTRFHHVSTCYVAGRYPGIFRETDLDKGQSFNNYYEETKFLSEVEVQERMRGGLNTTVYRPAIVVGGSRTGATEKYGQVGPRSRPGGVPTCTDPVRRRRLLHEPHVPRHHAGIT